MRPVQAIVSSVVSDVLRRQPPSPARTTFAWGLVVGPALARASTVENRDGVLYVRARDARWTRELHRASDSILERLQDLIGPEVRELHIVTAP